MIPLSVPNFSGNEKKYVDDAVSQGWVSTGGAYIQKLEKSFSDFLCINDAVSCQSGTSAIHLSLLECGIELGDLVIVPTLTFVAAVNPVRYCGADPIFIDCDDSLCIDSSKLDEFCANECELRENGLFYKTTEQRIKAIVVVHVFGNMADMEAIMDIAEKYGLKVVEDATEALGTRYTKGRYEGKFAGTIGDFGAFSFNGNKIITTGGGGMVVARNKEELDHIRYISTQAKDDPLYYVHNEVGYNYRMTNVQAAIGVAQMEELPEFITRKNRNYDSYKSLVNDIDGVDLLEFREDIRSNKWFYSLLLSDELGISARDFIERMAEMGIQTRCIWGLINEQLPYKDSISYKIEKANYYAEHIVNIPCSTNLTYEDICKVVDAIRMICASCM